MGSRITLEEGAAHFARDDHSLRHLDVRVVELETDRAVLHLMVSDRDTRVGEGARVSGPVQRAMADVGGLFAVWTRIGYVPDIVTSNLNIHFLRACQADILVAEGRLLKSGRMSSVADVTLTPLGADKPSSQATVTFVVPQPSSVTPHSPTA